MKNKTNLPNKIADKIKRSKNNNEKKIIKHDFLKNIEKEKLIKPLNKILKMEKHDINNKPQHMEDIFNQYKKEDPSRYRLINLLNNNNDIIQNKDDCINFLKNIKSIYIFNQIIELITDCKFLDIIKYNKFLQQKLKIGINDYKKLSQIEIEIFPINKENKNVFINIPNEYKSYYYIYFNEDKKELKQNYFNKNEKIRKIKIIIDKKIKSFEKLFFNCDMIVLKK